MASGRVGLALPGPRCPLRAPGAWLRWAGLSGFGEAGCRPPRSWPDPPAWKERAVGRGVGGAEPGTGFPELLLLLGPESGNGPGLGPSDPLFSAPPNLRTASQIWFPVPHLGGAGDPDTGLSLGTQFPTFSSSGAAFGLVFQPGSPRCCLLSPRAGRCGCRCPRSFSKLFDPTRSGAARDRRGPRLGPGLDRSVWHRRVSHGL